jgi:maltose O-acetyltransferase
VNKSIRNTLGKLLFRLYSKARIIFFQLLSNQKPDGSLERVQAVQVMGAGKIKVQGRVSLGYFPSPHFFSTYGYLEARGKESTIVIGNNTKINNGFVAIAENSSISIGESCLIGTNVEIYDSDFHTLSASERLSGKPHLSKPVLIGNNVFIGSNVRIMKGVNIGNGAVIGNSSLVTKDIPENCLASGVPATVIRCL